MDSFEKRNACAEDRLLLFLARTRLTDEVVSQAKRLIRNGVNWTLLYDRANHHRVVPLLHRNIQQFFFDEVPDQLATLLSHLSDENSPIS